MQARAVGYDLSMEAAGRQLRTTEEDHHIMNAQDAAKLTPAERKQMSNHTPKKAKNRGSSTHGGKSQARAGWSCDDTEMAAVPTKMLPGKYRVTIPGNAIHFIRKGPKA